MALSTCYNALGFGYWEELCHEYMSSVLPTGDPRMPVDDLPSPMWRIIFLKDDCFLQPSCEVTYPSSNSDVTNNNNNNNKFNASTTITTTATIMMDTYDPHDPTTCPSHPIEPLFEGIDLNHSYTQQQKPRITTDTSNPPSLSRSSSSSDMESYQQTKILIKPIKRKRKNSTTPPLPKRHRQKKQKTQPLEDPLEATTLFEQLSYAGVDWCRYCGTTEGVNWRPGPWGKRTLCNKHGCDYKGYGLASRLPRLDLSDYRHEHVQDRYRPVIQEFCSVCQERGDVAVDNLVTCDGGCSRAFHRHCFHINKTRHDLWFCSSSCSDNRRKKRVVVDLPRKQPLMRPLK